MISVEAVGRHSRLGAVLGVDLRGLALFRVLLGSALMGMLIWHGSASTVLLVFQTIMSLMLTLGWHTRFSSLVSVLLWCFWPASDFGELYILGLLCWLTLLPAGARFSVDAALAVN